MKRAILLCVLVFGTLGAVPKTAEAHERFSIGFGFPAYYGGFGFGFGGCHHGWGVTVGVPYTPYYGYSAATPYYPAPAYYSAPVYTYALPAHYPAPAYYAGPGYCYSAPYYYYGFGYHHWRHR